MKIKVSKLTGAALDWAVAKCEGATNLRYDTVATWWFTLNGEDRALSRGWSTKQNFAPSTDWVQGGPIIDRLFVEFGVSCADPILYAAKLYADDKRYIMHGPTHLIAAMRCYVVSKMGNTVDIPDKLI